MDLGQRGYWIKHNIPRFKEGTSVPAGRNIDGAGNPVIMFDRWRTTHK